jgi:hypothetical protein
MRLVTGALKHLEQNEIADQEQFPAGGSSLAVASVRWPRKCAIQTELSTRITTGVVGDPDAFRPDYPPTPIP